MPKEGYQPSPQEIKKAEDTMTKGQKNASENREELSKKYGGHDIDDYEVTYPPGLVKVSINVDGVNISLYKKEDTDIEVAVVGDITGEMVVNGKREKLSDEDALALMKKYGDFGNEMFHRNMAEARAEGDLKKMEKVGDVHEVVNKLLR
ncbi:MAG: hypothetical protein UW07_C0026G0002 [Candidatus Nomurabacteria bacterium GW2011_GWF2_43_8]|uniref:Uncharacterized protein n=2 Tax=Candidatus Nomuraibacteriota TaxID=1752729 RepID=A0A0G1IJ48_9BACT|nr:MAG: hypothetical protein UW02_C0024G0012 [Candidatus Nomurabacteria bacterium GW2011_GWB1_43_7]KKT23229.1 MAG: hypothetical protein UW07_C0026G0002 [Candidatus Nomurabacteria bacterium GW2011_GWF2_43_8]